MEFVEIKDLDPHDLYKVCQITIDGKPSMYFVKDERGLYHKDILREILKLNNLPYPPAKVLGGKGWVYRSDGAIVNGMGGAKVLSEKCILLFGNSIDFDMSISDAHVEEFRKNNPEWRFKIPPSPKESLAS